VMNVFPVLSVSVPITASGTDICDGDSVLFFQRKSAPGETANDIADDPGFFLVGARACRAL
jgi:hypothetical protein